MDDEIRDTPIIEDVRTLKDEVDLRGESLDFSLSRILPAEVLSAKAVVEEFSPADDKFGDALLAQAYYCALKCRSGKYSVLAKMLGLPTREFEYYMKTYPDFAVAVRAGIVECKQKMEEDIVSAMLDLATGKMTVTEDKTDTKDVMTDTGELIKVSKSKSVVRTLAPDVSAAKLLLEKIDPSYKTGTSVQGGTVNVYNNTLNLVDDVNVSVDYRKLSPDTLQELISSQKEVYNKELNRTEDGTTMGYLAKANAMLNKEKKTKKESPPEKINTTVSHGNVPKSKSTKMHYEYLTANPDAKERRPVGRPKNIVTKEPEPKRPVGRPKKVIQDASKK